jgi:hypothetical protein
MGLFGTDTTSWRMGPKQSKEKRFRLQRLVNKLCFYLYFNFLRNTTRSVTFKFHFPSVPAVIIIKIVCFELALHPLRIKS